MLVYDAGPAYAQGMDSGDSVVVPYLEQRGYRRVDRLLISHSDNDHLGGGEAVFRRLDVQQLQSGEPAAITWARSSQCRAGQSWNWDGVRFEYLAPLRPGRGNNASCVLRVETADGRAVLLPGDIEHKVEAELAAAVSEDLDSDLLVAAHHGSGTSTSSAFLDAVSPGWVLYARGYANRYGFPSPEVRDRVGAYGAEELDTALTGAVWFGLTASGLQGPKLYRREHGRLWNYGSHSADAF